MALRLPSWSRRLPPYLAVIEQVTDEAGDSGAAWTRKTIHSLMGFPVSTSHADTKLHRNFLHLFLEWSSDVCSWCTS